MPAEYGYALGAAMLWALSSIAISGGLGALRGSGRPAGPAVITGVLTSLTVGALVLGVATGWQISPAVLDPNVIAGGLLTFPIGTGLYYFAAVAHQGRAELSSQYANVKPALSVALGAGLFGEAFGTLELVVMLIIGAGVAVIVASALRQHAGLRPAVLGLALAACWAGGEACIRAATDSHTSLQVAFGALLSSLLLALTALAVYALAGVLAPTRVRFRFADFAPGRAHCAFALHGLLSFGLAYTLFFTSIATIGLSRTVLVTVFWPSLALALGVGVAKARRSSYPIGRPLALSLALFAAGSGTYVVAQLLT